jgi:hypothetical protein
MDTEMAGVVRPTVDHAAADHASELDAPLPKHDMAAEPVMPLEVMHLSMAQVLQDMAAEVSSRGISSAVEAASVPRASHEMVAVETVAKDHELSSATPSACCIPGDAGDSSGLLLSQETVQHAERRKRLMEEQGADKSSVEKAGVSTSGREGAEPHSVQIADAMKVGSAIHSEADARPQDVVASHQLPPPSRLPLSLEASEASEERHLVQSVAATAVPSSVGVLGAAEASNTFTDAQSSSCPALEVDARTEDDVASSGYPPQMPPATRLSSCPGTPEQAVAIDDSLGDQTLTAPTPPLPSFGASWRCRTAH